MRCFAIVNLVVRTPLTLWPNGQGVGLISCECRPLRWSYEDFTGSSLDDHTREASRGFEPRSLDSESRVLTVTPRGQMHTHAINNIFNAMNQSTFKGTISQRQRKSLLMQKPKGGELIFVSKSFSAQKANAALPLFCLQGLIAQLVRAYGQ